MTALLRHIDARTDARAAGLVRIAMGLVGMLFALVTHRDMALLFQPSTLRHGEHPWLPELDPATLPLYTAIGLAAALLFTIGWFTRVSGAVLICLIIYRHLLDATLYHNYTALLGLFVGCLMLGDAGASWSVDALRRGERGGVLVPLWPQTLIKYQICVVYFYTALGKINPGFLNGHVYRENLAILQPLDSPLFWRGFAVCTIALELLLPFCLWVRRARPWAIALGTFFHVAILFGLGFYAALIAFSVEFISIYLLFVEYKPASYLVVWDDGCSFCRWWIVWFRRLDWLGVLRFAGSSNGEVLREAGITPEEATREIKLVIGAKVYGGFDAVRRVLAVLPVSLTWEPVLRLPPVRSLGDRAYRAVAVRRMCLLPRP